MRIYIVVLITLCMVTFIGVGSFIYYTSGKTPQSRDRYSTTVYQAHYIDAGEAQVTNGAVNAQRSLLQEEPETNTLTALEKLYKRGRQEYKIGNYKEAIHYLNDFIASETSVTEKTVSAQFYIALALKKIWRFEQSKQELARIINADDAESKRLAQRAIIEYADICRYQNVYEHYIVGQLELQLRLPDNPDVENQLRTQFGYQMLFMGNYTDAIHCFLRSSGELAQLGKARAYYEAGKVPEAFAIYEEFILYNDGSAYIEEVRKTYHEQVYEQATKQFKQQNYYTAIHYFGKIHDYFPNTDDDEQSLFYQGECYFAISNYTAAITNYNLALLNTIPARDADALLRIGICYYWLSEYATCYNVMDEFIQTYPGNPHVGYAQKWKRMAEKDLEYMR